MKYRHINSYPRIVAIPALDTSVRTTPAVEAAAIVLTGVLAADCVGTADGSVTAGVVVVISGRAERLRIYVVAPAGQDTESTAVVTAVPDVETNTGPAAALGTVTDTYGAQEVRVVVAAAVPAVTVIE